MNKYSMHTINLFTDSNNIRYIFDKLVDSFSDTKTMRITVARFLQKNLIDLVRNYVDRLSDQFMYSDEIEDPNVHNQLNCMNAKFIRSTGDHISIYVLKEKKTRKFENISMHQQNDGASATSRNIVTAAPRLKLCDNNTDAAVLDNDGRSQMTASDCLKSWKYARRPVELRDDTIGTINGKRVGGGAGQNAELNYCGADYGTRTGQIQWFDDTDSQPIGNTTEQFTASTLEENNQYDPADVLMSAPKIQLLNGNNPTKDPNNPQNNVKVWADGWGFSDTSDQQQYWNMLAQKNFRNYYPTGSCPTGAAAVFEDTPCQIPWFERALYKRNYERDVDETIGGFEYTSPQFGTYDMSSLQCRVNKQNKINKGPTSANLPNRSTGPVWVDYYPNHTNSDKFK